MSKSGTSYLVSQVPLPLLTSPCLREQELLSLPKAGKPANRERRVPAHRSATTGRSNQRHREGAPSSQRLRRDAPTSSKRHLAGPWRLHPGGSGRPWEQDAEGPCAGSPHAQAQGADRQQIRRRRSPSFPLFLLPVSPPSLPPSLPEAARGGPGPARVDPAQDPPARQTRSAAASSAGTWLRGPLQTPRPRAGRSVLDRPPLGTNPTGQGSRGGAAQDALLWPPLRSLPLCFCLTR